MGTFTRSNKGGRHDLALHCCFRRGCDHPGLVCHSPCRLHAGSSPDPGVLGSGLWALRLVRHSSGPGLPLVHRRWRWHLAADHGAA
ncbi:hypothetical protein ACFFX0_25255 [Citricoccus parietis]|uniref:Uncharacterized protein n=1 Tax=Citricoccus parietis TaxID=592307 RepID=A0ABV5G5U5_9MICC